jgi:SAM-dependent methyltransferase
VFAVEPNPAMRAHLAARFAAAPRLTVVAGSAEATTLPDRAAEHAVVMQAFHWFDVEATRRELARVLAPGATVVLAWNTRRATTPFMRDLEAIFRRFAPDYDHLGHVGAQRAAKVAAFFRHGHRHVALDHQHPVDAAGLADYVASVSDPPAAGHPDHTRRCSPPPPRCSPRTPRRARSPTSPTFTAPLPA